MNDTLKNLDTAEQIEVIKTVPTTLLIDEIIRRLDKYECQLDRICGIISEE